MTKRLKVTDSRQCAETAAAVGACAVPEVLTEAWMEFLFPRERFLTSRVAKHFANYVKRRGKLSTQRWLARNKMQPKERNFENREYCAIHRTLALHCDGGLDPVVVSSPPPLNEEVKTTNFRQFFSQVFFPPLLSFQ